MPPLLPLLTLGVALAALGLAAIRFSGAESRIAGRLAGARQLRVGDLLGDIRLPDRPVRVAGRIRCQDPILTDRDERLVAYHRDVQVKVPGSGWRSIERIRETRGFELWDHDGSLPMDPALAAEPLVVIPHVWRGTSAELTNEAHRAALARLGVEGGAWPARSVTRILSVVEHLLVLAAVERTPDGGVTLSPPPGGYVISGLELDDAMRLLAGSRRSLMLAGYAALTTGGLMTAIGIISSFLSA
jgi:hypothetical protein